MVSWQARISEALLLVSLSLWTRQFLPESSTERHTNLKQTANGLVSVAVFLIDIVDVVFDCIFAKRLVEDGESVKWAIALVVGTLVSHVVDIKSLLVEMSFAETCWTELAAFYVEDVTMIMIIGNVNGAYDPHDVLDVVTVWFSAISAVVTLFQLLIQLWQTANDMPTKISPDRHWTRKICLLIIFVLPSCLFLGLLGELLIDGELVLDQGPVMRWASIILYVLCISFGLIISVRVLLRPIKGELLWPVHSSSPDGGSSITGGEESHSQTDYVLS